jgi:hypothetical protein
LCIYTKKMKSTFGRNEFRFWRLELFNYFSLALAPKKKFGGLFWFLGFFWGYFLAFSLTFWAFLGHFLIVIIIICITLYTHTHTHTHTHTQTQNTYKTLAARCWGEGGGGADVWRALFLFSLSYPPGVRSRGLRNHGGLFVHRVLPRRAGVVIHEKEE